jgi:Mce-associated membrane protein
MAAHNVIDSEVDAGQTDEEESDAAREEPASLGEQEPRPAGDANGRAASYAVISSLLIVLAVAGVAGWLGYRVHQSNQVSQQRAVLLETARQAAVNLTTISYTEVDADIKRIVDSSTGHFRDDFQQRSPAFMDVVRQAQAKSVGTVTAAGLQSVSGGQAQALVAVSVQTSNAGVPEQQPRAWRMRISVTRDHDEVKVSDVQFVP